MGFLDKILGRTDEPVDRQITPDLKLRPGQLLQLQGALGELVDAMRDHRAISSPGWSERVQEYVRAIQTAGDMRSRAFAWEELVDLTFEIRPAIKGPVPEGMEAIGVAQDKVSRVVEALRVPTDGEIG
ncbi:MAG TPA: hypothetical protein PKN27_02045 [Propionibacteriaceae bacterium]|nr:hypothetical protein [Propionibacteriaceae bacterium]